MNLKFQFKLHQYRGYARRQKTKCVSNVGNKNSTGKRSVVSTASSARLKAEADLAALMARQKLLKDKHELEECLKGKRSNLNWVKTLQLIWQN